MYLTLMTSKVKRNQSESKKSFFKNPQLNSLSSEKSKAGYKHSVIHYRCPPGTYTQNSWQQIFTTVWWKSWLKIVLVPD